MSVLQQKYRALALIVTACMLVVGAFVAARMTQGDVQTFLDNTHWTIAYLTGAVLGWLGVRWADDETRSARRWLAYGLTANALGQLTWDAQVAIDFLTYPALSDVLFLCYGPLCAVGMLTTMRSHSGNLLNRAQMLDAGSIAIGLLTLVIASFLPRSAGSGAIDLVISVAYPVLMWTPACIAFVMVPTLRLKFNASWMVFFVASILNGFIWQQWISLVLDERLKYNTWLYLVFSLTAIGLGAGSMLWRVQRSDDPTWERNCDRLLRMLPLLVVGGASVSVGLAWSLPNLPRTVKVVLYGSAVVVCILAIVRQSFLLLERDRLIEAERRAQAQRAQLEAQLFQAQKLEAVGTLASGIAHDFNNILGAILGNIELALLDIDPASPAVGSLQEIRKAGLRAKDMVRRIVAFGRPQNYDAQPLQLAPMIEDTVRLMRATLPAAIEVTTHLHAPLPHVLIDSSQFSQVLLNLFNNAHQAMRDHRGRIDIALSAARVDDNTRLSAELNPGEYLCLSVRDSGHGIDATVIHRIFDPFFTTKPVGEGSGLGLSIVRNIVRAHSGAITVENRPGAGATFNVFLPAVAAPETPESADVIPTPRREVGVSAHILYVDDEEALVFLTRRFLERFGHRVSGFTSPAAALAAINADSSSFDLIITDQSMPGMSGMELAREVLRMQPGAHIVLVSGYIAPSDVEQARAIGIKEVILKPTTVNELAAAVHRLWARQPTAEPA